MNVKKNVKKVFAMATGVALMGATMAGALAYDLGDYPQPFVDKEDGNFNGAIVVGEDAATADVVGAIDIAASLQAHATKDVEVEGSSAVSVEGGEDFDSFLNEVAGEEYTDKDLEGFQDDEITLNDNDYDFEDFFNLTDKVTVATSALSNFKEELNYGDEAYMEVKQGTTFSLEFEGDGIDLDDFDNDEEFDIDFLGKTLTVSHASGDDATNKGDVTLKASTEYYMESGDSVEVDGHTVTLKKVGESSVLVDVDGQVLAVSDDGTTKEFDQADDFEVVVESAFYIEGDDDNSATLKLGSSLKDTYDTDEALEIFGGTDDEDEATWLWDIGANSTHLKSIGIKSNMNFDKLEAEDNEERAALAMGEEFELPNNYASVSFAGWESNAMDKYEELTVEADREDLTGDSNDEYVYSFTSSYDDAFVLADGTTEADEVYLYHNGTDFQVWYDDGDDTLQATGAADGDFDFELDETVDISFSDSLLTLDFGGVDVADKIELNISDAVSAGKLDRFGSNENTAEGIDFSYKSWNGTAYEENVNGKDDLARKGTYGMTWDDVENMMDSDELTIDVPFERQEAKVVVTSEGSSVSSGSEGGQYEEVQPIGVGLGMLDTDAAASLGNKNMIVVGGPSINTVAMELMDNPTTEEIQETFTEGKAMIKWYDDQMAMLVAGWEAEETHQAAQVLVSRADELSGDEVEVSVVGDVQDAEIDLVE